MLRGFCTACDTVHTHDCPPPRALAHVRSWLASLADHPAVDDAAEGAEGNLRAALRRLRAQGQGKMLAAAEVVSTSGEAHVLRAFSGDLWGRADWPGCVPALVRRERTQTLEDDTLRGLHALRQQMAGAPPEEHALLKRRCRALSANLMRAMHDAATLITAGGSERSLRQSFQSITGQRGIPSGTGDCALPKLLQHANAQGYRVVSVAEVWWGPATDVRDDGALQEPCREKCQPILGTLLCPR
jgi:hypothetical protein